MAADPTPEDLGDPCPECGAVFGRCNCATYAARVYTDVDLVPDEPDPVAARLALFREALAAVDAHPDQEHGRWDVPRRALRLAIHVLTATPDVDEDLSAFEALAVELIEDLPPAPAAG